MADLACLTLGLVALAGLFTTCVEWFDYIDTTRAIGPDYQYLATRLEIEEARLFSSPGDR